MSPNFSLHLPHLSFHFHLICVFTLPSFSNCCVCLTTNRMAIPIPPIMKRGESASKGNPILDQEESKEEKKRGKDEKGRL